MATNNNPLKQLSVMAGKDGLSSLHIPTITDGAEDVVGKYHPYDLDCRKNICS